MPSPVQESLISLANSILATKTSPGTGEFLITLSTQNPLQVPDATPVRTVAPGQVDLTLVMKNVRFVSTLVTDKSTVGGMPIQQFATQLLNGPTTTAGVPGLLGGLTGTVPVVIDTVNSLLNVQIVVRISVRDNKNQLDPYINWSFSTGAQGVGGQGTSTPNTTLPTATLKWRLPLPNSQFVGAFTELSKPSSLAGGLPIQLADRTILVEVNLSAAGVSTGWIALTPLPAAIPAIPIPTLVALFDDVAFNADPHDDNGTLILLPDDSPLAPAAGKDEPFTSLFKTALQTLHDLVNGLVTNATNTGGFNPFNPLTPLVSGIENLLTDMTSAKPATQIHWGKASTVLFLGNPFMIHDSDPAQDRVSAILVLGPLGLVVNCYNHANFDPSGGAFDIRVGLEMAVAVPSLTPANPPSVPIGNLTVIVPRPGFNDCLSSIRMVKS